MEPVLKRDVTRLTVPLTGAVVAVPADPVAGVQLIDAEGNEIVPVSQFLQDMRASGASRDSARSYALALLRWFRFLRAVEVSWDRAGRAEARDFMLWMDVASKPGLPRRSGTPAPGAVNQITHKPAPGIHYAIRTRHHNRAVVRAFYEFHRENATGPLVNPMPPQRGRTMERANAHHNPLEPYRRARRADFQPKLPRHQPRFMPDEAFDALFAAMRTNRDRAIIAFYISTGARASELLGVTCDRVDIGQQLIGVIRKGSHDLQWLPASPDAFTWLGIYRKGLGPQTSWLTGEPLWRTVRRPYRPLTYAALRAVLIRAQASLGTNWTLHDLRHTAARRMTADPALSLSDVQWVLGHAQITTTQIYTDPGADEVITRMRDHHAAQAAPQSSRPIRPPAPGYRPEVLATLLGAAR